MQQQALLITTPSIDFDNFLSAGQRMTGRNIASTADACQRQIHDSEKYLLCLADLGELADVMISPHMLEMVSFGMLVWGQERDIQDVIQICGAPHVYADTVTRGIVCTVISSTLADWRQSLISGLKETTQPSVRVVFQSIMDQFLVNNLSEVWKEYKISERDDIRLLEHK